MRQPPLRIALVSEHASPLAVLGGADAGGQNVHVAELARQLARQGAEVVVHTRRDDPFLPRRAPLAPGVVVDHVDAGPPVPLPKDELLPWMGEFADDLVRAWRARPPHVVHAHFWMSGLAARQAAREVGAPVALTYHALGAVKRRHQGAGDTSPPCRVAEEAELARTVDLVIATTRDELDELCRIGAVPRRAVVVPCGVDLRRFRPRQADPHRHGGAPRGDARGPVPPRRPGLARVVTVGRLVERKGVADLVRAVAQLPGVELLVAGGPPAGLLDGDREATRLLELGAALGMADRLQLLGAVPPATVPALLRSADVACNYPWYEPFGIAALEAMACGVPVVAAAVGGLAETVLDGVTGRLVPPRRPDLLADALRRLLADAPTRRAMGGAGARRAEAYGWAAVAACTFEHLAELVGHPPVAVDRGRCAEAGPSTVSEARP